MRFKNPQDFLDVFGATCSTRRLGEVLGLPAKVAARLAKQRGIKPLTSKAHIPGLEHLPGAPSFMETRQWAGGTIHRIDCRVSGDSPGYRSLLIHRSAIHLEDPHDDD